MLPPSSLMHASLCRTPVLPAVPQLLPPARLCTLSDIPARIARSLPALLSAPVLPEPRLIPKQKQGSEQLRLQGRDREASAGGVGGFVRTPAGPWDAEAGCPLGTALP